MNYRNYKRRGKWQYGFAMAGFPLALACVSALGQQTTPPPVSEAALKEPGVPLPSADVAVLLAQADKQQQNGQYAEMLATAKRARDQSRTLGDHVGEAESLRRQACALTAQAGQEQNAIAAWRTAAGMWDQVGNAPGRVEALGRAGALMLALKINAAEGKSLLAQALRAGQSETRRPLAASVALNNVGRELRDNRRFAESLPFFNAALAGFEKGEPGSLNEASSWNNIGMVYAGQNNLLKAKEYFNRALALRQKVAPNSLPVAESWNNLALVAYRESDYKKAEALCRTALGMRQKAAPDLLVTAESWNNLGFLLRARGDLNGAEEAHHNALRIRQKLAPDSVLLAESLNDLGRIARDRGALADAETYYRQSLAIKQTQLPDSIQMAEHYDSLGQIAYDRSDYEAAEEYATRALRIREQLVPGSLETGNSLLNLGNALYKRNKRPEAGKCFQQARAIYDRVAPGSLNGANCLVNLAKVSHDQKDFAGADRLLEQSLTIKRQINPTSLDVSYTLNSLGIVALAKGDLKGAEQYLQQSAAINKRINPESLGTASDLKGLGSIAEKRGDYPLALKFAQQAWDIVQKQAAQVVGDEARQAFGDANAYYANNLMRYQLKLNQTDAALMTLEQGRARALEQLLSERRLLADVGAGPQWDAYQRSKRIHDEAVQSLTHAFTAQHRLERKVAQRQASKANQAEIARLQADLRQTNRQVETGTSEEVDARVKMEADYAVLKRSEARACPPPLSLAEAMKTLPPNTVFAAFSVGESETTLFLLRGGKPTQVFTTRIAQAELQKQVRGLRDLVAVPGSGQDEIALAGRKLWATLFPPAAQSLLMEAKRLIVSPDDALWEAPFAALVVNASGPPQWLGLARPLTLSPSLTLLAANRSSKRAEKTGKQPFALIVGDPVFDHAAMQKLDAGAMPDAPDRGAGAKEKTKLPAQPKPADGSPTAKRDTGNTPAMEPTTERGYLWENGVPPPPLPGTREEAHEIAALYHAVALLGEDATEAEVRRRIGQADIIHLATHGVLRRDVPTASGLLLTAPLGDPAPSDNDGALQAWELFGLKLNAELAILSACETGKGSNRKAEGLIGLTRALQYAGCRSTITSQWSVSDTSTASLMVALHQSLRKGMSKDVALLEAMKTVQSDEDGRTSHPFYWAAFVLTGDPDNTLASSSPATAAVGTASRP